MRVSSQQSICSLPLIWRTITTSVLSLSLLPAPPPLGRRLSACEIMGSETTICSDKTGSLTLNQVRMVFGDNLQTTRAIALECGILSSSGDATEPNIIDGRTFRNLTETQRLQVADRILVMGRSSPRDKLLLVQALRQRGHVIAVTGDATNDTSALYEN